jgi:hypothetical protein
MKKFEGKQKQTESLQRAGSWSLASSHGVRWTSRDEGQIMEKTTANMVESHVGHVGMSFA